MNPAKKNAQLLWKTQMRMGSKMDYVETFASPVGLITIASSHDELVGLWLEDQKHFGANLQDPIEVETTPFHGRVKAWLDAYFAGDNPEELPPCNPRGTQFQLMVWRYLEQIPYGQLVTYGDIARMIEQDTGRRSSPRAVGSAVGRNPISIIVPCHRVVGAKGALTGYAGGVDKKQKLLKLELAVD